MIIVDAKDQILGRLATKVAKLVLTGEQVRVVNCDHVIITGNKEMIFKKMQSRVQRGIPSRGPFYPKQSDRIVRRTIRGMLPYKQPKGRVPFGNVLCFVGVPKEFQEQQKTSFDEAHIKHSRAHAHVYLKDIVRQVGGTR